jgi:hypothetical protein
MRTIQELGLRKVFLREVLPHHTDTRLCLRSKLEFNYLLFGVLELSDAYDARTGTFNSELES